MLLMLLILQSTIKEMYPYGCVAKQLIIGHECHGSTHAHTPQDVSSVDLGRTCSKESALFTFVMVTGPGKRQCICLSRMKIAGNGGVNDIPSLLHASKELINERLLRC